MDLLLDTHAILWLAARRELAIEAQRAVAAAMETDRLLFSAVSAWEIVLLARRNRFVTTRPANEWIEQLLDAIPMLVPIPLEFSMAVSSGTLPEPLHRDPADRLLVATARQLDVPIVTRDARILAYAQAGHVRAIAC